MTYQARKSTNAVKDMANQAATKIQVFKKKYIIVNKVNSTTEAKLTTP